MNLSLKVVVFFEELGTSISNLDIYGPPMNCKELCDHHSGTNTLQSNNLSLRGDLNFSLGET